MGDLSPGGLCVGVCAFASASAFKYNALMNEVRASGIGRLASVILDFYGEARARKRFIVCENCS